MQARERSLALIVAALLGLWLVDALCIGPLMAWFEEQNQEIAQLEKQRSEALVLIDRKDLILQRWRSRHATGLLSDEQTARFKMQEYIVARASEHEVLIEHVGGHTRPGQGSAEVYATINMSLTAQGHLRGLKAFVSALEQAPMPLRLERCELASHDSKKDHMELSVALSTLIVSEHARAGRTVPEETPLWQSAILTTAVDKYIVDAKPFLSQRRKPLPMVKQAPIVKPPIQVVVDPGTWALVGITRVADQERVFLRHTKRAEDVEKRIGESIDGILLQRLEQNVLIIQLAQAASELKTDASVDNEKETAVLTETDIEGTTDAKAAQPEERAIAIGFTFAGKIFSSAGAPAAAASSQAASTTTRSSGSSTAASSTTSEADRQAILERLRNRRSRKDGN